jgi:xylulose-5-phosphate/fructose-6-phosphate phosphoketolase
MVMLNDLDRYHLVIDVIDRVPGLGPRAGTLRQTMTDARFTARSWTRDHGEDLPEIVNWSWPNPRTDAVHK